MTEDKGINNPEIIPCDCGNSKVQLQQFAAPATYSVECSWNRGGCNKQGEWRNSKNQAIEAWNKKALHG